MYVGVLDNGHADADFWLLGYGKLQLALPSPNVVDIHVSEYGAVILDRDEATVAGFFVLYLDAELILVGANELHFARPLVIQRGYGILSVIAQAQDACCRVVSLRQNCKRAARNRRGNTVYCFQYLDAFPNRNERHCYASYFRIKCGDEINTLRQSCHITFDAVIGSSAEDYRGDSGYGMLFGDFPDRCGVGEVPKLNAVFEY